MWEFDCNIHLQVFEFHLEDMVNLFEKNIVEALALISHPHEKWDTWAHGGGSNDPKPTNDSLVDMRLELMSHYVEA